MMDWTPVVVAGAAGAPAILAAVFAYRSSATATRSSDRKVDVEVFERTQGLYDRAVEAAQREIDRLVGQQEKMSLKLEEVREELDSERDTSAALKRKVADLETQGDTMKSTIAALQRQLDLLSQHASKPPFQGMA